MPSNDLQKLIFTDKRRGVELQQLRDRVGFLAQLVVKLQADLESLKLQVGGVPASNVPAGDPVPASPGESLPEGVGGAVPKSGA